MRSRDVTIPLALWICAAICAHFMFGTGGLVVAQMYDDRSLLWKLSREAAELATRGDQTFEATLEPSEERKDEPPVPKAENQPKPVPEAAKPPPRAEPKKEQPPAQRVVVVEKQDEERRPIILPEDPLKDRRIAVRQHAKADQQDNPSAKFVADEANRVEKETVARQTVHDRDDENPTPGGNHPGSEPAPGDSERTRIAESEEHKGEPNRAPGEKGREVDVALEPKVPKPQPASGPSTAQPVGQRPAPTEPPASKGIPQPVTGGATPASPDTETGATGDWTFNPARSGGSSGNRPETSTGRQGTQAPGGKLWNLPGLGQPGTPGAMNTNLNPAAIASIVGVDNLRKLREADGERRKSEHRGSWMASSFERWRSAIENYVSSVKEGNQTALNAAQVPFASYLNGMHNRIHPIFADSFLESLDSLPGSHPMNDQHLVTRLEIVLTKDGHLKKMGIVKTSGITGFDIAALDAVDRAQPFGPVPNAIVSPDGNVYLHWEFHRDEVYACSTMGAKPFILNTPNSPPNVEPTQPRTPGPSSPTRERGSPAQGANDARG